MNRKSFRLLAMSAVFAGSVFISGCSTVTGLPGHGGGKRFAVEQELLSSSIRATIKDILMQKGDIQKLKGHTALLAVQIIGDQGSGNLIGSPYTLEAALRGNYINAPTTRTTNSYPLIPTVTTTTSGDSVTTTNIENALNAASETNTTQDGSTVNFGGGIKANGGPRYGTSAILNTNDAKYLQSIILEALRLWGVELATERKPADVIILVTVDVFGTVRSRTDYHLFNKEKLVAKTAMQVTVLKSNGKLFIPPVFSGFEAEYKENYILWSGPINGKYDRKMLRKIDDYLKVDFHELISGYTDSSLGVDAFNEEKTFKQGK